MLPRLLCTMEWRSYSLDGSVVVSSYMPLSRHAEPDKISRRKLLIFILLLISGNVQPNPGPTDSLLRNSGFNTPSDFKTRTGLGFIHLNARSLISKLDMLRIWAHSTDADIIVISETWLNKSTLDNDICIDGYKVYRTDRPSRGGGIAMFVKSKFCVKIKLSVSLSKYFELLAVDLEVSKNLHLTVVGCYRPPSAVGDALPTLMNLLSQ